MTNETFDFSKTPRWTLLKMLTSAFVSRQLSLAWTEKPAPKQEERVESISEHMDVTG